MFLLFLGATAADVVNCLSEFRRQKTGALPRFDHFCLPTDNVYQATAQPARIIKDVRDHTLPSIAAAHDDYCTAVHISLQQQQVMILQSVKKLPNGLKFGNVTQNSIPMRLNATTKVQHPPSSNQFSSKYRAETTRKAENGT